MKSDPFEEFYASIIIHPSSFIPHPLRQGRSFASSHGGTRSVVHTPHLSYPARVNPAFNNFITKQREESAAQEQRSRIPIPIDARRATCIINGAFGL